MKFSEIAKRYAIALFEIGEENKSHSAFLGELKKISEIIEQDKGLKTFVSSPLVAAVEKLNAVQKSVANSGVSQEVASLVQLLAQRDRLILLSEIAAAYEARVDRQSGITRGVVTSSSSLSESERTEMQNAIAQATNKKIELDFVEDKSILGGVVAKVGSLTFDDSLSSHLRRIEENLNRSVQ